MRIPNVVVSVAAAALAGLLTGCAQGITAPVAQTEEQRVLAVEDEYVAAEVSRDEATLRRIVDDRFTFNSSNGTTTLIEGDVALVFGTPALQMQKRA